MTIQPTTAIDPTYPVSGTCHGLNHRDHGQYAACDGCGASVYRVLDANGRVRKVVPVRHIGASGTPGFYCFDPAHECDPASAALKAVADARRVLAAEIVKGSTVRVARGRKVPVGTVGTVFWTGKDAYDNPKVGLRTETGERHFTATANVDLVQDPAAVEAARALVAGHEAAAAAEAAADQASDMVDDLLDSVGAYSRAARKAILARIRSGELDPTDLPAMVDAIREVTGKA